MRTRKTTMLEKMIPEPLTRGLFTLANARAYVDALALVVEEAQGRVAECTRAAHKAAEAKDWSKVLGHVLEGMKWRLTARDAADGGRYMAGLAAKETARLRKSKTVRRAMGSGHGPAERTARAILRRADAMDAESKAQAREIGENAEQPDGLGILEGMARMNLGLPIPKRCRVAGPLPSQRASGQRGAKAEPERVRQEMWFTPAAWAELQVVAAAEKKGDVGEVLSRAVREECRTFRNRVRAGCVMGTAKAAKRAQQALAEIDAGKVATA